jgi:hypothetical protein
LSQANKNLRAGAHPNKNLRAGAHPNKNLRAGAHPKKRKKEPGQKPWFKFLN